MTDWLLEEAMDDVRALLEEFDDDDDAAITALRNQAANLERASAAHGHEAAERNVILQLTELAFNVREEAIALRQRHRSVHRLLLRMMD